MKKAVSVLNIGPRLFCLVRCIGNHESTTQRARRKAVRFATHAVARLGGLLCVLCVLLFSEAGGRSSVRRDPHLHCLRRDLLG